jgi:lysophospholipase L1-like esterase
MINERLPNDGHSKPPPAISARRLADVCAGVALLALLLLIASDHYVFEELRPHEIGFAVLLSAAVIAGLLARSAAVHGSRYVILRVVVAVAATAVALLSAEGVARLVYRNVHSSGNARDYIARHSGSGVERLNSRGFRDAEIPPKTPDRYRIVVVGDSFTAGNGIEEQERFSNLIGQFLGPSYEVLNFGRPAENMGEHLRGLEEALEVSPDFVLLQLFINDFETARMLRPAIQPLLPPRIHQALEGSSLFYQLVNGEWAHMQGLVGEWYTYPSYMAANLKDPNSPNSVLTSMRLRTFFERARSAHLGVGAVLFPAANEMGRYGSRYPFGYLHERVWYICAEEHVPCLDLLPAFSKIRDPRTMFVSPFDAHPNAMANRHAAYEIMARFGDIWAARGSTDPSHNR